jgi:hypothetical protein
MHDLTEIQAAADALPSEAKRELLQFLLLRLGEEGTGSGAAPPHSIFDIEPVHLGAVLQPLARDDDLLGEMLEGRQ